MPKRTDFLFKLLNLLAWLIFIGLCIESGGLMVNAFISLFINPAAAFKFWGGMNLYQLHQFNQSYFVIIIALLIIASILKTVLFYLIVNLFHKKKLNFSSPFNKTLGKYIFNFSYLAFTIGLVTYWGNKFSLWLSVVSNGAITLSNQNVKFEGSDVWLFMGVILIIFGLIFKQGIELQSENDLTV